MKGCSGHVAGVTQTSRLTRFSTPCVNISVQQEKRIKNLRLKSGECRLCSEEQKKDYRKSKLVPKLPPKRKIKECRLVPVFPAFLRKTMSRLSVSPLCHLKNQRKDQRPRDERGRRVTSGQRAAPASVGHL